MTGLVGRLGELAQLRKILKTDKPAFAAVYGRRRIGKTFLIRAAFNDEFAFTLTGMANVNTHMQLANFYLSLQRHYPDQQITPPSNWLSAFDQLVEILHKGAPGKKVIFLDELPWLDTAQSGFLPALEHFWNSWASKRKDIILVVCGSAASWMISQLLNSRGGLHNRVTHQISLAPFTLYETELFFRSKSAAFDRYQLILLYMVMGGVPFYLDQVDPSLSAAQNIDRLCFDKNGPLRREFDNLYRSLFLNAGRHITIVEALGKKARGLTRDELLVASGLPNGGGTTRMLNELEESGFIRRYSGYGKKQRDSIYQLADFYSFFYLKWMKRSGTLDANTWLKQIDTPAQRAWGGYAFEQVCLAHISQIKQALGISGIDTTSSSWIGSDGEKGAQVDLLIDRRDRVINLCEMKFSIHSFTIDKKYAGELAEKIRIFREHSKTRKAIYLTMITTFGLTPNSYAHSMVQNDLAMDVLFENVKGS